MTADFLYTVYRYTTGGNETGFSGFIKIQAQFVSFL